MSSRWQRCIWEWVNQSKSTDGDSVPQILENEEMRASSPRPQLWPLETWENKEKKNQSCGFVFDFSQLHVSLILGQPCHLPAADPTELRLAWQEVLKGCRQKSSIVEHAVLTARVFSHTCPIKNLGSSWINYIEAFTLKWKERLCAPAGASPLLGSWQMHLAQCLSPGWGSSAPSRCVASIRATSSVLSEGQMLTSQ